MSNKYEDCVKQYLARANKEQIRATFDNIINLVGTIEKISVSPQVKALYVQVIISTVNERDTSWTYDPNNVGEKLRITGKMLLNVPDVLVAIKNSTNSNFVTASTFLHYAVAHLDLWCPFDKPPEAQGSGRGTIGTGNVTSLMRSGSVT